MFKASEIMLGMVENLETVLDYWMEQVIDDKDRPGALIKTMCELAWPGRRFMVNVDDEGRASLADVYDIETGETALELHQEAVDSEPWRAAVQSPLAPGLGSLP